MLGIGWPPAPWGAAGVRGVLHSPSGVARASQKGSFGGSEIGELAPPPVDTWTLIYDGDCEFCRRQVRLVRRWDVHRRVHTVPFQTADLANYGVSREAADEAMQLVAPSGRVYEGAAAAREILRLLPRGRPLSWLFKLPGAPFVAERVYRWVAKRRHRFGCNSEVCHRGAV